MKCEHGERVITDNEKAILQGLTLDKVTSAYSGKNGKCCCGCSGKHYRNDEGPNAVAMVRRIFHIVMAELAVGRVEYVEPTFVSVVVGQRLYVVYTK